MIKDISTPEFTVNREFRQRLQSRSESNIVHTDQLLSSLALKSCTSTSTYQWTPNCIELFSLCQESQEETRSCCAPALHMDHGCKLAGISWPGGDPPRQGRCTQRERSSPGAGKKGSTASREVAFPASRRLRASFPVGKLR